MIKFENTEVEGWKAAIRGMRNPMNSWSSSDSGICLDIPCDDCVHQRELKDYEEYEECCYRDTDSFVIGKKDFELMKKLVKAGTDHSKFMRMINVTVDITAPLYWVQEHDTYKVGTVRNSCSFMHKGVSKPFEITDFSIEDTRVYDILKPKVPKHYELVYPYETNEYKTYATNNGRKYKVYKNGRVFREGFVTDNNKTFAEKEVKPSVNNSGYYEIHIGGRNGEKWLLHRLVAFCWIDNPRDLATVNHINGDKGNNSVDNLEMMSIQDNIKAGFETGLYKDGKMKAAYAAWKNGFTVLEPLKRINLKRDYQNGMSIKEIADKYEITYKQANNATCGNVSENESLYLTCLTWECTIDMLNTLRSEYLETNDTEIFLMIRQLLPMGYNIRYTWQANYQVLRNIYHSDRKHHKLKEWREGFMDWIKNLPYSELITE